MFELEKIIEVWQKPLRHLAYNQVTQPSITHKRFKLYKSFAPRRVPEWPSQVRRLVVDQVTQPSVSRVRKSLSGPKIPPPAFTLIEVKKEKRRMPNLIGQRFETPSKVMQFLYKKLSTYDFHKNKEKSGRLNLVRGVTSMVNYTLPLYKFFVTINSVVDTPRSPNLVGRGCDKPRLARVIWIQIQKAVMPMVKLPAAAFTLLKKQYESSRLFLQKRLLQTILAQRPSGFETILAPPNQVLRYKLPAEQIVSLKLRKDFEVYKSYEQQKPRWSLCGKECLSC